MSDIADRIHGRRRSCMPGYAQRRLIDFRLPSPLDPLPIASYPITNHSLASAMKNEDRSVEMKRLG